MRLYSGAVLLRDQPSEEAHYADRFDSVRHRGLRQAFQALNPGLMICHPDTFQVRYANAAAREIFELENKELPQRLPESLIMTRQEEFCDVERRYVACYRTEIAKDTHEARAYPVYAPGKSNVVESVLVVVRDYNDVSWSLFEMLDKMPIAVAAVTGEVADVRYINRRALREVYGLKSGKLLKRAAALGTDRSIEEALASFLRQAPEGGEGCAEVAVGRAKADMHFAKLGANDGSRLIYWDPRGQGPTRH